MMKLTKREALILLEYLIYSDVYRSPKLHRICGTTSERRIDAQLQVIHQKLSATAKRRST